MSMVSRYQKRIPFPLRRAGLSSRNPLVMPLTTRAGDAEGRNHPAEALAETLEPSEMESTQTSRGKEGKP
jgi:hypothetical protein